MVMEGGKEDKARFPALVALIEHPTRGRLLFDTGYAPRFFEATAKYPYRIYAQVTPVACTQDQTALAFVQKRGLSHRDIGAIFISHFHGDHVAGLKDFPQSKFIYSKEAWDQVRCKRGLRALLNGFLPDLIPHDFSERGIEIRQFAHSAKGPSLPPFSETLDLYGDGHVIGVCLPGHFKGQWGLIVNSSNWGKIFLCADAAWVKQNFEENKLPSPITAVIHHSWREYKDTIRQIHQFWRENPDIKIVPTHCQVSQAPFFS